MSFQFFAHGDEVNPVGVQSRAADPTLGVVEASRLAGACRAGRLSITGRFVVDALFVFVYSA